MKVTKSMPSFIIKRILHVVPILLGTILLTFLLLQLSGDPLVALSGDFALPDETVQHLRAVYGLDKSIPEQFVIYLGKIIRGDLGESYKYGLPVTSIILDRLPATLLLGGLAYIISTVVGVTMGVIASLRPRSRLDNLVVFFSISGFSTPNFWLAQLSIVFFSVFLGWLPSFGMRTLHLAADQNFWFIFVDRAKYLILPVAVLSINNLATLARVTRANMLDVMHRDFITAARAKGCSEFTILIRHELRNILLVVVTIIGLSAGPFLTGSVLIETVFAWPGIGRLMYEAILSRDYPIVMGVFLFGSMLVVAINLITDILYTYLDPRVRY